MNILLLGKADGAKRMLVRMLEKSRHRLIQHELQEADEFDLAKFDMVLVDGDAGCAEQSRLLEWVREARRRYPHLPVAALNEVGAAPKGGRGCGVSESGDGVWHMRCRLQDLALSETAALLSDACDEKPDPIVFEYAGHG